MDGSATFSLFFETRWGTCAAGISARGVCRLALPFAEKAAALAWIERVQPSPAPAFALPDEATELPAPARRIARKMVRQVCHYFVSPNATLDFPLDWSGASDFHQAVWAAARTIPFGETRTYGEVALLAGRSGAARAVGTAMRKNRTALIVPCHRVVAASGLGGFNAPMGLAMKKQLLAWEKEGSQAP